MLSLLGPCRCIILKCQLETLQTVLSKEEIEVSYCSIYNWIEKYSKMTSRYLNDIVPRVGNWFRADEAWVKINGKQCVISLPQCMMILDFGWLLMCRQQISS